MIKRSIKVKVLRETSRTVTIKLVTLNRRMPVSRSDFEQRVKDGEYEVVGSHEMADSEQ
ncbi:MAG: hypothetical protein KDC66_11225 [Phaeodactylibacter sp.]|nr:hypothetical protein [Phaeodactylibacter sp.]MCB9274899.1 hypothetical protein [Lewinellaceae bacterium]